MFKLNVCNFFNISFLNRSGSALSLVLFLCAIISAAAVYVMNLSKESDKKVTANSRVLSYSSLVTIVANKLHSGTTCTDVLPGASGLDISNAFNENGISIQLDLQLALNRKPLRKPSCPICHARPNDKRCLSCPDRWFVHGGTSVKDVVLVVKERLREPVQLDILNDPKLVAAVGYIFIVPNHSGVGVGLSQNKRYRIPIFLYYQRQGRQKIMRACFNPASEAMICTSMGGAFNWKQNLPEDQRCQPDLNCFSFKSGMTNSSNCPAPYRAAPVGWNGHQLYLCNWCNVNGLGANQQQGGYYFNPKPSTKKEMDNPPPPLRPIVSP